jgi:hypothetical protein
MGYVPVTINGVAYPKNKKDPPMAVTIVGQAWVTGLSVGGGPATPPPHPDHTLPPYVDNTLPPIDNPPPEIPTTPSEPKPPPPEGGWGWSPDYGWGYFPGNSGPQPHGRRG